MHVLPALVRQHLAALRVLLTLTVILGVGYPVLILLVAQVPGLRAHADGSLTHRHGAVVGSTLIGQLFTDRSGNPLPQYFQPRPSDAGAGYDPTASGASNLGPESIVDKLPDPRTKGDTGTPSLLTQVCERSLAVGRFDGVSAARPFCTSTGVGAVLGVSWSLPGYTGHVTRVVSLDQPCPATPFLTTYRGVRVTCATYGEDDATAQVVAVRGHAPADPAVPPDAVTASGSGLDPDISPAYARIQEARVAHSRGIPLTEVRALVARCTTGRDLGFMGEPRVNVLELDLALDREHPSRP